MLDRLFSERVIAVCNGWFEDYNVLGSLVCFQNTAVFKLLHILNVSVLCFIVCILSWLCRVFHIRFALICCTVAALHHEDLLRGSRFGYALPIALLLCFASVIVWTENLKIPYLTADRFICFILTVKQSQRRWRPLCFQGDDWNKRLSTFLRKKVHPCDLARGCSDLEMTWLLWRAGAASKKVLVLYIYLEQCTTPCCQVRLHIVKLFYAMFLRHIFYGDFLRAVVLTVSWVVERLATCTKERWSTAKTDRRELQSLLRCRRTKLHTGWAVNKPNRFQKFATHLCNDTKKRSVYQNQYFIENKTNVLNFIAIRYSLH